MIPSEYAHYHNQKLKNLQYWNMLSFENGTDLIIENLIPLIPPGSEVFEYGAGRGRNAIPLSEEGHHVTAQDIGIQAIVDLIDTAKIKNLDIHTLVGDARDIQHYQMYDVFVVIRMLHFLPTENAMQIIENSKIHTKIGGYNAYVIFSKDPEKDNGFYFPNREEFLEQYVGWKIIFENSIISKTVEGKDMPRFSILLQRVD